MVHFIETYGMQDQFHLLIHHICYWSFIVTGVNIFAWLAEYLERLHYNKDVFDSA